MASQGRYSDANALQYGATATDTQGKATHVAKHKKRNKGLHIVFDPVARQKYVGGFRQRKLERKENAKKVADIKAKKQRLEDRAARRAKQRKELNLDQFDSDKEDGTDPAASHLGAQDAEQPSGAAKSGPATVHQFHGGGVTTTVSTAPITLHSSSESEHSQDEEDLDDPDHDDDETAPIPQSKSSEAATAQSARQTSKARKMSHPQKHTRKHGQKQEPNSGKRHKKPRR